MQFITWLTSKEASEAADAEHKKEWSESEGAVAALVHEVQEAAAIMIQKRARGNSARKAMKAQKPPMHDSGAFAQRDGKGPAGKGSRLYVPRSLSEGPVAAVVLVHGLCVEGKLLGKALGIALGIGTFHWTYMGQLAGFSRLEPEPEPLAKGLTWPGFVPWWWQSSSPSSAVSPCS